MTTCVPPTGSAGAPNVEGFVYSLSEGALTVGLDDRVRTAEGARVYDLRRVTPHPPDYAGPPGPMPIEPEDLAAGLDMHTGPVHEVARLQMETREVLILGMNSGDEERVALLVDLPDDALASTRSWLVNAAGYDLHRGGDYARSKEHFLQALQIDPGNALARYNLACAYALLEDAPSAVRALQGLPPDAGLREKVARDPDFDPIRKRAHFKDFLAVLDAEVP